jgi:hypothetical protein
MDSNTPTHRHTDTPHTATPHTDTPTHRHTDNQLDQTVFID